MIRESLQSAITAIFANKLRSALTMLGVVIGVGSVIAMIGIGEGARLRAQQELEVNGSKMITIMPDWRRGGQSGGSGSGRLSVSDLEQIRKNVPLVELSTGIARANETVKFGSNSTRTNIWAAEPQIAIIRNAVKMHSGQWYTAEDEALMSRKAVLGYEVYDKLFGGENAIGATIKIKGQNFEVIGVVTYKGGSGMMNPDDMIYIPLKTGMQRLMGKTDIDFISTQISDVTLMPLAQAQIEDVLYARRRTAAGEALFRVMNQSEALQQLESQNRLLSMLLAGIGSVSLLVGGIGIMNIMLVSVTERTREIGLRKALGAQKPTILSQFLTESVVMCVMGGVIGIGLGFFVVRIVAQSLQVPPVMHPWAVGIAFGFAAFVGLFFGLYPAIRASNLQPIEALRYE